MVLVTSGACLSRITESVLWYCSTKSSRSLAGFKIRADDLRVGGMGEVWFTVRVESMVIRGLKEWVKYGSL